MTFEQKLSTLTADPRDVASPPLIWFKADLSDREKLMLIQTAGALPYAIVAGLEENERETSHDDGAFLDQRVILTLYQKPEEVTLQGQKVSRTPNIATMYALYTCIWQAAKGVDAAGLHRTFLSFSRDGTQQPPKVDLPTLGLYARLSFRLKFFRG